MVYIMNHLMSGPTQGGSPLALCIKALPNFTLLACLFSSIISINEWPDLQLTLDLFF